MISYDLILDSNNDLTIENGDFAIGESDSQNIQAMIQASKGQFYENPLFGYGILSKINSPVRKAAEKRALRQEAKKDNYDVTTLIISDDLEITIDANKIK